MTIEFDDSSSEGALALQSKQMDLEAGWLGRCFGSPKSAPFNIAALLSIILVAAAVASLFLPVALPPGELWKMIMPFITGVVGFVFGRSGSG